MKLGFALPHIGPIANRSNIHKAAQEAEALGYATLWTNERVLVPLQPKTPYPGTADGVLNPEYETVFEYMTALTYAAAITSRMRSASLAASAAVASGNRMASSSPPKRAAVSMLRICASMRCATSLSALSPAKCPYPSLIPLNRSMSIIRQAMLPLRRCARASSSFKRCCM